MKHRSLLTAVLGLCLFIASACTAQSSPSKMSLRQLDRNGDSKIQFSEISAMRSSLFDRGDKNRNGVLEPPEIAAMRSEVSTRRSGKAITALPSFAELDGNNDGVVNRDEFVNYISPRLRAADTNGDGAISRSEIRALR